MASAERNPFKLVRGDDGQYSAFDENLVYLVGGERREFDISDFPRQGRILIRDRGEFLIADAAAMQKIVPGSDDEET